MANIPHKWRVCLELVAVLVGLTLVLCGGYAGARGISVRVGVPGDVLYVQNFYSDEAPRFRWSKDNSSLTFAELPSGALQGAEVVIEMAAPPTNAPQSVRLLLNGGRIGQVTPVPNVITRYSFPLNAVPDATTATLELQTTPVSQPSDSRKLGVRVQRVELHFGGGLPSLCVLFWTWALGCGLFVLVIRMMKRTSFPERNRFAFGSLLAFLLGALLLALPLVPNPINPLWYVPLLPVAAAVVWLLYALSTLPAWVRWLADLPARLNTDGLMIGRRQLVLGDAAMIGVLVVYAGFALWVAFKVPFIGHADYADNAVVARNLVAGKGYTVDYVAQFYNRYPTSVSHAADTWPLLQPTLIAPFFAIFGATVWAAKLPNVILMLLLTWSIYRTGRSLFGRAAALAAAVLTLATPLYFDTIAYPINDLAFAFFLWLASTTIYRAVERPPVVSSADALPPSSALPSSVEEGGKKMQGMFGRHAPYIRVRPNIARIITSLYLWGGVWLGLLMLTKPSGAVPAVAILGWALVRRLTVLRRINYGRLRGLFLAGAVAALVLSPYLIRNQLQFGKPLYTTESYDAYVLHYIGWENIYNLYKPDYASIFTLPSPGGLTWDGVTTKISTEWRDLTGDLGSGTLTNSFVLALMVIGMVLGVAAVGRQRGYSFAALFLSIVGASTVFTISYWHYESRYFQPFLPFLYLFACGGLLHGASILRTWLQTSAQHETWAMNLLAPLGFFIIFMPLALAIYNPFGACNESRICPVISESGVVKTSDWMRATLPANAVVMTRNPWEMTFHTDLKTVMIPNRATLDEIRAVAKQYGVGYIQLDHLRDNDPPNGVWYGRTALRQLLNREDVPGFTKMYDSGSFVIYAIK